MRLELRARTELALRTIEALADRQRRTASELAELVGSTPAYLAHVLTDLSRRGWVESVPGRAGGHRLAVEPAAISVLELIEAIEGPTDVGRCVMADRPCPSPGPCALHDAWIPARDALLGRLAATPLASVIGDAAIGGAQAGSDSADDPRDHEEVMS